MLMFGWVRLGWIRLMMKLTYVNSGGVSYEEEI
jgi:hypothetical protein